MDGNLVCEGNSVEGYVGCQAATGATSFKVCGPNVKVVAHLLTECSTYGKYSQEIGTCDSSKGGACQEVTLTSGYTNKVWLQMLVSQMDCQSDESSDILVLKIGSTHWILL